MPSEIISQLNGGVKLTNPASGDLFAVTDVSDTTEATSGTTKPMEMSEVIAEKIRETDGPDVLAFGDIIDGEFLKRVGGEVVSATPGSSGTPFELVVACSDEDTPLVAGTALITFRIPRGVTLTGIRAHVKSPATTGTLTIDINEGGSTILSTKITIDAGEETSVTAATPPVISDANLADDAKMTVDLDDDADGTATGLKVTLIGTRT